MDDQDRKPTQLLAHSFSKSLDCSPHCRCAVSASLMLSIIELRSRHSKNASRACQQWARAFRLGASKAPSVEGLGLSTASAALPTAVELGEAERRPIWCVYAGRKTFFSERMMERDKRALEVANSTKSSTEGRDVDMFVSTYNTIREFTQGEK